MKKKKNKPENRTQETPPAALRKLQMRREKEKKDVMSERNAVFLKKMRGASARKAPFTLRTKGYYRFSRDYPADVDGDGLRENAEQKKHARRRGLLMAAVLVLVFCASFIAAKTAWYISTAAPRQAPAATDAPAASLPKAGMRFTGALNDEDASARTLQALQAADADIAVLDLKDGAGIVFDNAGLVSAIHAEGRKAAAYICCFRDPAAAEADNSMAVRSNAEEDSLWKDNAGDSWLNPFSAAAREYLLTLVTNAADSGYDYILLDSVCFPSDAGSSVAGYPGENEFTGTRNQLLRGFVNDAVAKAGTAKTILMCKLAAFDPDAPADKAPYYGNLLGTSAGTLCADARLSVQPKNVTVGETVFNEPSGIPFAFTLGVGEYAMQNADGTDVILCLDAAGAPEETVKAVLYAGAGGYILW